MPAKFPCGVCQKNVSNNSIQCDSCDSWVHFKCSNLTIAEYDNLSQSSDGWVCPVCLSQSLPFSPYVNVQENLTKSPYNELFSHLNQCLENIQENKEDDEVNNLNIPLNCSYMNITEFNDKCSESGKNFSLFHLNVASLSLNFENLNSALCSINQDFDVIGVSETRINVKDSTGSSSNINISNYSFENTSTESSAEGTGLYISNNLVYKRRPDLEMYKKNQLESTFVELISKESSNIVVSCIYRHPCMSLNEFNDEFLQPLLTKLSVEHNKKIYLMGDFNVDLLKADLHLNSTNFLNILESNSFSPKILLPTRVTSKSRTLIDNIFSNQIDVDTFSGNLDLSFSDHLPQFLVTPVGNDPTPKKHNIFVRDMRGFNQDRFKSDIQNVRWDDLADHGDIDHSFNNFLNKFNAVLDTHAPLKKANKKQLKAQQKPWITGGILCSMRKRDNIFRQLRKCQGQARKDALQASVEM